MLISQYILINMVVILSNFFEMKIPFVLVTSFEKASCEFFSIATAS